MQSKIKKGIGWSLLGLTAVGTITFHIIYYGLKIALIGYGVSCLLVGLVALAVNLIYSE